MLESLADYVLHATLKRPLGGEKMPKAPEGLSLAASELAQTAPTAVRAGHLERRRTRSCRDSLWWAPVVTTDLRPFRPPPRTSNGGDPHDGKYDLVQIGRTSKQRRSPFGGAKALSQGMRRLTFQKAWASGTAPPTL